MFNVLHNMKTVISQTGTMMTSLANDTQAFQVNGHKQSRFAFASLYTTAIQSVSRSGNRMYSSPTSLSMPGGIGLVQMGYDMSQGSIRRGDYLNAAIQGNGFFLIQNQNSYQQLLTRASDWVFSADGTLSDVFGRRVKGYRMVNGVADTSELVDIVLDPNTYNLGDIGFEGDGILTTNYAARAAFDSNSDEEMPEGEALYQLAVASVPNPSQMKQVTGTAFSVTTQSGSISSIGVSGEDANGSVIGGSVESSNVNPSENAIEAIQLQRSYQAQQSVLTLANKFLQNVMDVVGKA